jgi:hypothetical protein
MAIIVTAILYFGIVFTFAFAMGVFRVLVVAPLVGPAAAVFIEVPIILAASWIGARRVLRRRTLGFSKRLAVGGLALMLLMALEAMLASVMLGQSVEQWAAAVATPLGLVGLAGQLGFTAIPAIAVRDRAVRKAGR